MLPGKGVTKGVKINKGMGDVGGWTGQSLTDNIATNVSESVMDMTKFFDDKGANAMIYPQVVTDIESIIMMTGCGK
jgi:uncharacterized protein YbjQ (UPF0145 family)